MTAAHRKELPWRVPVIPLVILLASWIHFCLGTAVDYRWTDPNATGARIAFVLLAIAPLLVLRGLWAARFRWWPRLERNLIQHNENMDALPRERLWFWIALSAAVGLFLELVIIRFHSSCFQLFAYFKNVSLLSCFLGLGIGYSIPARKGMLLTPLVLPLLALQIIILHAIRFTPVGKALQNPITEENGMGFNQARDWVHFITSYAFLIFVFALNAACFIPLGHLASRLMSRSTPLAAYSWNLIGSLVGILLFYLLSFLWVPPAVWFGLGALMLLPFLRGSLRHAACWSIVVLSFLSVTIRVDQHDIYSPYQVLTVIERRFAHPLISVNHVYYQRILDLGAGSVTDDPNGATARDYYALPYLVKPKPANVLIVGSGTGNDVASAIRHGAGHVDAVEIDPAILNLGKLLHPESPYQSGIVDAHIQDARAFIRYSRDKYDLIVYGMLDSHTLLSGASGVRLDSYIYTVQAFQEARAHLKPGGVICVSFSLLGSEMGRKLYLMLKEAFDGKPPTVYSMAYDGSNSFVNGDNLPILSGTDFPAGKDVSLQYGNERFFAKRPVSVSTDDWPFFYMPVRKYPVSYFVMILILLAVSLVFIRPALMTPGGGFSAPGFFLGAGFMLLETKAITELALFYGSTWVVIGIVIVSILVMAFLANVLLIGIGEFPRPAAYGLLLAALVLSLIVSQSKYSASVGSVSSALLFTGLISLPFFFAGLAFSSELQRGKSVGVVLGSNLLGAMLGGCLEYNSMYFGYRSLYYVAIALYVLAFISGTGRPATRSV